MLATFALAPPTGATLVENNRDNVQPSLCRSRQMQPLKQLGNIAHSHINWRERMLPYARRDLTRLRVGRCFQPVQQCWVFILCAVLWQQPIDGLRPLLLHHLRGWLHVGINRLFHAVCAPLLTFAEVGHVAVPILLSIGHAVIDPFAIQLPFTVYLWQFTKPIQVLAHIACSFTNRSNASRS